MTIETFNRFENKYLIDENTFTKLTSSFGERMILDAHNRNGKSYTIRNLYYDTDDSQLIRHSLSKPKYKEKLRIRSYGKPSLEDEVFIEIKKKVSGLVNKRRSVMALKDAYDFLESGILPEEKPNQNRQVLKEIAFVLQNHALKPKLYLAYDRVAYFGNDDKDLRISFDLEIRSRRRDVAFEAGDFGKSLLKEDQIVMEIKVGKSYPLWLVDLLSQNKVYPTSYSKYGAEYKDYLKHEHLANALFQFKDQDLAFYEFASMVI
jgi:hypothetical protein